MAIVEVIKYNGTSDVFAWKYPCEELGTWTQLIVNESQEAVLFKGGKALDVFGSGRHTLDTQNIPLLNKIINLPFGGRSPFTAEVWYVNKLFKLDIKWGTASPIQIQDSKYGIFIPLRANGIFGIQIYDSKKFLVKLVGTMSVFDEHSIVQYFRGLYVAKVKDAISSYVVKKRISVLEINAYIDELSAFIKEQIEAEMSDYGIELTSFYVNEISMPEDDDAVQKLKDALTKKAEMSIVGYNYQQERSFDTMEAAVKNESMGAAPFMGAGMGIGMGFGAGGVMAQSISEISGQTVLNSSTETEVCPQCHAKISPNQRFCGACGYKLLKTCPKCKAILQKNVKFCPECGEPIVRRCAKCGAFVVDDDKFCPECGESLKENL